MSADTRPARAAHTPGPWSCCDRLHKGGCTCGMIWSIPADAPVATAIIGEWGDVYAEMADDGDGFEPKVRLFAYGEIREAAGKANACLIAAAPDLRDALRDLLDDPHNAGAQIRAAAVLAQVDGRQP